MPRDAQRSRVYRAESTLRERAWPSLDHCARFAEEVVGSLWWVHRFPEHGLDRIPVLRPGHGARQAFYRDDGPSITLPRRYRTRGVVLHELAHWALARDGDVPDHGRTFTRLLTDLMHEFGGARGEQLESAYEEHGVHVGPHARQGPDGCFCYPWEERLRLGRGRQLCVRYGAGLETVGVLRSRAHRRAVLDTHAGPVTIPERDVYAVTPSQPPSPTTGYASRSTTPATTGYASRSTTIAMP